MATIAEGVDRLLPLWWNARTIETKPKQGDTPMTANTNTAGIHHATLAKAEKNGVAMARVDNDGHPYHTAQKGDSSIKHPDAKQALAGAILAATLLQEYGLELTYEIEEARWVGMLGDDQVYDNEAVEAPTLGEVLEDEEVHQAVSEADPKAVAKAKAKAVSAARARAKAEAKAKAKADREAAKAAKAAKAEDGEDKVGGSILPVATKEAWRAAGHPNHCGDWLAETLNQWFLDENGFALEDFVGWLDEVGVDCTGQWANPDHTPGWPGRVRMSGRIQLDIHLATLIAEGADLVLKGPDGRSYPVFPDYIAKIRARYAKRIAKIQKEIAEREERTARVNAEMAETSKPKRGRKRSA